MKIKIAKKCIKDNLYDITIKFNIETVVIFNLDFRQA
jgi:hypothetical protein